MCSIEQNFQIANRHQNLGHILLSEMWNLCNITRYIEKGRTNASIRAEEIIQTENSNEDSGKK